MFTGRCRDLNEENLYTAELAAVARAPRLYVETIRIKGRTLNKRVWIAFSNLGLIQTINKPGRGAEQRHIVEI